MFGGGKLFALGLLVFFREGLRGALGLLRLFLETGNLRLLLKHAAALLAAAAAHGAAGLKDVALHRHDRPLEAGAYQLFADIIGVYDEQVS